MLTRFFGINSSTFFFFLGASLVAVGLPTSKVLMSMGTMLLVLSLLIESNFKGYWAALKASVPFLALATYFFMHVISLLWTTDFAYALDDLRIKLTLLVIPLAFISRPPSAKELRLLLWLFLTAVSVVSFYNFASFVHWIGNRTYEDIRELSLFGSHIRFGILIAVAAAIALHFLLELKSQWKWLLLIVFAWLGFYTYFSQIISGFLAFSIVVGLFLGILAYAHSKWLGHLIVSLFCIVLLSPLLVIIPFGGSTQHVNLATLDKFTALGNPYTFKLNHVDYFNQSTFLYVCEPELLEEWTKRSEIPYSGRDKKGQLLRFTLIRYMASKNLRKDAHAFRQLSHEDIRSIEEGVASVNEKQIGLLARLDGIRFQLAHPENPNGHSLLQRLEYWKAAVQIIRENWVLGVGEGDVQASFDKQYVKNHSLLSTENRLRAHNSYLTSWLSFGLVGIFSFLFMNGSFLWRFWKMRSYLPLAFIVIAIGTFLIEDTLETQMGVTFFAFFFGLFAAKPTHFDQSHAIATD
jgi:hypothetical protein